MAVPSLSQNATDAQAVAYLNAFWDSKVFSSSAASPYNGKTAAQIYAYIKQQHPTGYTPYQYAQAAQDVMLSSAVGSTIGAGIDTATTALGDTATGVATTDYGLPLTSLLSALTSANLWIRVAKIVFGGAVLIVGLLKLTGADQHVTGVAKQAVKLAPLL